MTVMVTVNVTACKLEQQPTLKVIASESASHVSALERPVGGATLNQT